jgi:moderate conductance mechanosensitive channel
MTDHMLWWMGFIRTHGVRLLIVLVVALGLSRLLTSVTRRLVRVAGGEAAGRVPRLREQQTRALANLLNRAGTAIIALIALLIALPEFGFALAPVAVAVGLALLAVGFGANDLAHDFINGFLTVFEDSYAVGDVVRVGNIMGRVEHLTLRRTVVRDAQGALVSIPNGQVGKVANLSRDWGQLFLDMTVDAGQPLDRAIEALEAVASEFRGDSTWSPMLVDGPRVLGVEALAADGTTLRMQARTIPNRREEVARELRRRIQSVLSERGIRLGGATRAE